MFVFKIQIGKEKKDERSVNDPLNYQAQNPEHPSSNPNRWLLDIFNSRPTSAGVRVDPETAPSFSAVYRCVSIISSTFSILSHGVYDLSGGIRKKVPDHAIQKLLRNPSELHTAYVWKENMMQFALLWGNGFSRIIRDKQYRPIRLRLLHSKDVRPFVAVRKSGEEGLFYEVTHRHPETGADTKEIVESSEMIHIPCLSFDGICGKSPVTVARENIGLGLAAEKFAGDFYKNDAAYQGIYTHPESLNDEAYHRLKESLADHSMYGEKGKTLLLEGGTTYNPITMPMRDAQFIESRKFQIEEIARMYGVPLHKLANLDRSTNNNIEQQALEFISDTMLAWVEKWEDELEAKLLTEKEKPYTEIDFNFDVLLRGDSLTRAQVYSQRFNIGTLSQNEIRQKEGEEGIGEAGDRLFIPLNMVDSNKEEPEKEPINTKKDGEGSQDDTGLV